MPDPELYMAREGYIDYPAANTPVPVRARATARAGHPIIARTPHMWVPLQVDYEAERPSAPAGELPDPDDLRAQAEGLGVKVDKRWSASRLGEEIAKAQAPRSVAT
jgi:hypothetical protein